MSNPYHGGDYEPYGGDPQRVPEPETDPEAPPPGPGAEAPYRRAPQDVVSIMGFVLSLLWCTSLIGLVLGIVGLRRTRGGARRGHWAAVAATVIGAIGTLAGLGVIVFFTWFSVSTIQLSSADVGQCTNVDPLSDSDDATLFEKDCDEPHDAEVAAARDFTPATVAGYEEGRPESLCTELDPAYADALASGDYALGFVVDEVEVGESYVCLLHAPTGDKLEDPVGD